MRSCLAVRTAKIYSAFRGFREDERGVSPIVATVLVMLIALVLAAFISDELRVWISDIFDKLNNSNLDAPIN